MENWWNKHDWQGKRRDQVEYSTTVSIVALILLALALIAAIVVSQ